MPPKRQRGEGSTPSTRAYDKKKFVSPEAADKFDHYLMGKALTPERGLRPEELVDGDMARMILERGWDSFTDQPDPAVISLVKEFYANAEDTSRCTVMIRGKLVSFSGATINEFYNIEPPVFCQYAKFVLENPNYDTIIRELCKPGTVWTTRGHQGSMIFPSNCLSRYGKIWYAFICAKLMPSTHVSDVTKERAVLLYAIVTGKHIDVGNVIEASIKRNLRPTQSGLPHPSLICGLCRRAGVRWGSDESTQQPLILLDHGLISRYKVWDGGESHPRGLGFIIPNDPVAETGEPSTSGGTRKAEFSTQLRNMQLWVDNRMDRLERQNARLAARQAHMFNSQSNFNNALTEMFARMNPTADPVPFPEPQPLPVYPPPDDHDDRSSPFSDSDD